MTLARRSRWVVLGLGLYAVVLLSNPLLHHDLACHVKSPTHCNACTASPLAPRVDESAAPDLSRLADAGHVESARPEVAASESHRPATGRSPPA